MTIPERNAQEILEEEILVAARREAEERLARAREEARAVIAKAVEEAARERAAWVDRARAVIERQTGASRAAVGVEIERRRSSGIEAVLQSIRDEALRRLLARDAPDLRASLAALTAEALRTMGGDRFEVELALEDRMTLGDGWPEEVRRLANRPGVEILIKERADHDIPGPVIRGAEGRQVWDNRFTSRLDRLWPALRRQIAAQILRLEAGRESEARS